MIQDWSIPAVDRTLAKSLQAALDQKTKPLASLGRLEQLALQLGLIQNSLRPAIHRPVLIVFAGDHGLAQSGVSPYPQAVTAAMVGNFSAGGAAINVLARQLGWHLQLVNSGTSEPCNFPGVAQEAIARGTRNVLEGPAMSEAQYEQALLRGAYWMQHHYQQGSRLLACGDMGIGNSSSAALLLHYLLGCPLEQVICRGAGSSDQQLKHKLETLKKVCRIHGPLKDPEAIFRSFGGFEMVMAVGAMLQAASLGLAILVDGLIISSAFYAAVRVLPQLQDYLIFAHCSASAGHQLLLSELQAKPLLALEMRLGEGTGAALALPLLQSACALLQDMATFESAAVPQRKTDKDNGL